MNNRREVTEAAHDRWNEVILILRFGSAGLLLGPGASKFITYGQSVSFFSSLEIPAPDVLVPVVGAIELMAAGMFLANRYPRFAAAMVIPIMFVAILTAGPSWQNLGLMGSVVIVIGSETPAISNRIVTAMLCTGDSADER